MYCGLQREREIHTLQQPHGLCTQRPPRSQSQRNHRGDTGATVRPTEGGSYYLGQPRPRYKVFPIRSLVQDHLPPLHGRLDYCAYEQD